MVIDDYNVFFPEPPLEKKILLTRSKIGKNLEGRIGRDLGHRQWFKLTDKNGTDRDLLAGNRLGEDCLACDAIRINMGDDGYLRSCRNLFSGSFHIIAKTHCLLFRKCKQMKCAG
jgi:hypothetical protein